MYARRDRVTDEQVRGVTLYVDELTSRHGNKLYARRDRGRGNEAGERGYRGSTLVARGDRVTDERRQGRGEGDRMCSCLMYRTTNDANYTNNKDRMDKMKRMDRRVGWAQ